MTPVTPDILWLAEPGATDPAVVGGKAANLARLAAAFPVPPGFCVTAPAHARHTPGDAVPEPLRARITAAYAALGERCGLADPPVAVRSSAVDEDGVHASFAGMFLSCLNVQGVPDILAAIARCWASAADPRVLAYRSEHGVAGGGVGVLVQQLVPADVAAVVFSVHPASGASDELVIDANWGLGESVVGGLVTPDEWVLRRSDLATLRFRLGDKAKMTVRADAGTREVPVLRTLRARPCLADEQLRALGELALRLEATMGWPVDLECAFADGRLHLLQCRPITTLRR